MGILDSRKIGGKRETVAAKSKKCEQIMLCLSPGPLHQIQNFHKIKVYFIEHSMQINDK